MNSSTNLTDHMIFFGENACFQFGVNQLTAYVQLETVSRAWLKFESTNLTFVLNEQFCCQIDSFWFVISATTVSQVYFHNNL